MNLLRHNPVTDLSGPQFLAFFAIVAVITCFLAYCVRKIADRTRYLQTPTLPETFDPFEIAYLRGGSHEQKRLIILDLVMRGYLSHTESSNRLSGRFSIIEQAPQHPDPHFLDTDSRMIFNRITSGLKVDEIARIPAPSTDDHHKRLSESYLVTSKEDQAKVLRAMGLFLFLIAALTVYRLAVALSRGHTNVVFLIFLTVASMITLFLIARPRRLTSLGRRYLRKLQGALSMMKARVPNLASEEVLLAVAVHGIGILKGTSYDYYPKMFQQASQGHGGCGSASCGGSGCGGGGGGCGGCGGGD
ncbi:MAG TPA: TIGR04222 domain-containing membrane protein [Chthoniobacterales bacterium]